MGGSDGQFPIGIGLVLLVIIFVGIPVTALGGVNGFIDYARIHQDVAIGYAALLLILIFIGIPLLYKASRMTYIIDGNFAMKENGLGHCLGKWDLKNAESIYVFDRKNGKTSIYFNKIDRGSSVESSKIRNDVFYDFYLGFDWVNTEQAEEIVKYINILRKQNSSNESLHRTIN